MVAKEEQSAELEQLPNNVLRAYLKEQDLEELSHLVENYSGLRMNVYERQSHATATKSQIIEYLLETMGDD